MRPDVISFHELFPFSFNMANFAVFCMVVFVACLGLSCAAPLEPHGPHGLRNDMAEKFVEFIKQDEQLSNLLSEVSNTHESLIRNRRANSMDDVESVDETTLDGNGTPGFFDRAAKFVMEVLQRFLRWINTDD